MSNVQCDCSGSYLLTLAAWVLFTDSKESGYVHVKISSQIFEGNMGNGVRNDFGFYSSYDFIGEFSYFIFRFGSETIYKDTPLTVPSLVCYQPNIIASDIYQNLSLSEVNKFGASFSYFSPFSEARRIYIPSAGFRDVSAYYQTTSYPSLYFLDHNYDIGLNSSNPFAMPDNCCFSEKSFLSYFAKVVREDHDNSFTLRELEKILGSVPLYGNEFYFSDIENKIELRCYDAIL